MTPITRMLAHAHCMLTSDVVVGWDIGGVNTKMALVDDGTVIAVRIRPFELQRNPQALIAVLRELAAGAGLEPHAPFSCGVTMTAELSQVFRRKREGVCFVLDAVHAAFPRADVGVLTVDGSFISPADARRVPLAVAAANWAATAAVVARSIADGLLVDVGTTTTDIIPIVGGRVVATGRTDPERLGSAELLYTGAVRTPVEAIVEDVPFGAGRATVSAESFALTGDVHVWRGALRPADYAATPDGRPSTREFAGERLARVICADRDLLGDEEIDRIAESVARAQIGRVASAIGRVWARHPAVRTAVVTGVGAFIGESAARHAGLAVVSLSERLGEDAARAAPAAAVALLLDEIHRAPTDRSFSNLESPRIQGLTPAAALTGVRPPVGPSRGSDPVEVVVKVGGALVAHPDTLDRALAALAAGSRQRLLVVPGGGPFADVVRAVDRRVHLTETAAHWMAITAMDQYAHLIASRMRGAMVVDDREHVIRAIEDGHVPVLAPSRWLRAADPLPHSWDVTSDSIAAWIAGQMRARRLVLLKPPGARGESLVDAWFARALPANVVPVVIGADDERGLKTALGGP